MAGPLIKTYIVELVLLPGTSMSDAPLFDPIPTILLDDEGPLLPVAGTDFEWVSTPNQQRALGTVYSASAVEYSTNGVYLSILCRIVCFNSVLKAWPSS